MRIDARQLVHHHPQPLGSRGNLQPQQLLHCQAVGEIVGHGAEVINAVGHGNDLLIKLGLAGLLNAGVQIPDVGHDAHNRFAIDFKEQAQHPVSRWVLRPHVQDNSLIVCHIEDRSWSHFSHDLPVSLDGIVLAEWISFPIVGHQNALEVGMFLKTYAEQIEDFAFEEVGSGPDGSQGIYPGIVIR